MENQLKRTQKLTEPKLRKRSNAIVATPVLNMRKNASDESEVVSQALYGEKVIVFEEQDLWSFIQTPDRYSGWVLSSFLEKRDSSDTSVFRVTSLQAPVYFAKDITQGPLYILPFGVDVEVLDWSDPDWIAIKQVRGDIGYVRKGTLSEWRPLDINELPSFGARFLGVPYLWGGRSSIGFDCSGFVQMLYCQMGVLLQRDSSPQSKDSRFISIQEDDLRVGSLIFWGFDPEKIRHVGLYIGEEQFIHASIQEQMPWVRISSLNDLAWRGGVYPYQEFKTLN